MSYGHENCPIEMKIEWLDGCV